MAVRIRLRRMGRKKKPHYRVVVTDRTSPRDGRFVESLGHYQPLQSPARLVIDLERVDYWIGQGAVPSDTVDSLLSRARRGGDADLALGEIDPESAKERKTAQIAAKRKAEADLAKADAEAAKEPEVEAHEPAAEEPAAESETPEEATAETDESAEVEEAEAKSEPAAESETPEEVAAEADESAEPEADAKASAESEPEPEAEDAEAESGGADEEETKEEG